MWHRADRRARSPALRRAHVPPLFPVRHPLSLCWCCRPRLQSERQITAPSFAHTIPSTGFPSGRPFHDRTANATKADAVSHGGIVTIGAHVPLSVAPDRRTLHDIYGPLAHHAAFVPSPPHPDPTPRRGSSRLAWYAPRPSYCISSRGPLRGLGGATRANPTRRRGSSTRMRQVVESPPGVDRRGGGATDEQDGGEGRLNRRIGQQGASRTIEGSGAKNGYAMRRRNNRQTGRWRVVVYQTIRKAGAAARQFFYTIDTWLPTAAPRLHEIGSAPLARHKTALII